MHAVALPLQLVAARRSYPCEALGMGGKARKLLTPPDRRRAPTKPFLLQEVIAQDMLRYHLAFYLPRRPSELVVAEALDFPER